MSKLKIYNSATHKKENFIPIDEKNIKMYVCGPTVNNRPHIGNIRSAVVYDVLYRLLSILYPSVTYVRNITDIDDKIIAAANETGKPLEEITTVMTAHYNDDVAAVGCLPVTHAPKATQHLKEMFDMISELIKKEHAYVSEGHVYFDINSYKDYGWLSGRSKDEMIAGSRIEISELKKNPGDFVLWKPSTKKDDKYSFDSPWGRGRPGWHIECSAMSSHYLGSNFDIHGGGLDLLFPHHENEVAQSVCSGNKFANYWIHNGFLTLNGEKMSKSLNNFTLLKDILASGVNGVVIRYFFLATNYRKPMDYNSNAIHAATKAVYKLGRALSTSNCKNVAIDKNLDDIDILCDDLNTSKFLSVLQSEANNVIAKNGQYSSEKLAMLCSLVGLSPEKLIECYKNDNIEVESEILELAQQREEAKKNREWKIADEIREIIKLKGYSIEDGKDGCFKLIKEKNAILNK